MRRTQAFPSKLEDLTEEKWSPLMDVGLKGYFFCAQAAGRHMLQRGNGSIVMISSLPRHNYPLAGAYSIARLAVCLQV